MCAKIVICPEIACYQDLKTCSLARLVHFFAPKCRWGIKEKPLIMIDYQRLSLFYHLIK